MAENFIVEKDGKKYVYRSTSVYDQQTHRKRSVSEYVGRIDPETGALIEKKNRTKVASPNREISVKHYGPSHALVSIAESSGLRDDLNKAFGRDGDKILAVSISLMLSSGPLSFIEPEMESNMSRELLGLANESAMDIEESVNRLCDSADSVEELFRLRCRRSSKAAVFSHTYRAEQEETSRWIGHTSKITSDVNYCIATDIDGVPVFFEPCYEVDLSLTELRKMVDRIIGFGVDEPMVFLDSISGSAYNLEVLTKTYISFVVPARKRTPVIKQMLSQVVKKKTDPRSIRQYRGNNYIVFDDEVTIAPRKVPKKLEEPDDDNETADLELISASDPRFQYTPLDERIVSWACLELGEGSDKMRDAMDANLLRIESRLQEMDPYEAIDRALEIAGYYSRFFELRVVEGELEIKIRQKAVTAAMNREGIFVLLSHGIKNWIGVMQYYTCREKYESSTKVLKSMLSAKTEIKPTIVGDMVTKFVALTLWTVAEKRLQNSDLDMSVPAAMQHLSLLMATGDGLEWQVSEINSRIRKIMDALMVRVPEGRIKTVLNTAEDGPDE